MNTSVTTCTPRFPPRGKQPRASCIDYAKAFIVYMHIAIPPATVIIMRETGLLNRMVFPTWMAILLPHTLFEWIMSIPALLFGAVGIFAFAAVAAASRELSSGDLKRDIKRIGEILLILFIHLSIVLLCQILALTIARGINLLSHR